MNKEDNLVGDWNASQDPGPDISYEESKQAELDQARLDRAMTAYTGLRKEDGGKLLQRLGTDASEWATEFILRFPGAADIDTMRGWFANAIESGRTAGHNYAMTEAGDSARKLGVDLTEVYTIGHLVEVVHTNGHPKFENAAQLGEYLQNMNDAGQEPQVPILDANKVVWLTYGEEHSSGGEANTCHLLQGDPRDDFMVEKDPDSEDEESEYAYVPVPLTDAAYPVTLLYAPPAE